MKYLPREVAFGKPKALVEGTNIVRAELDVKRANRHWPLEDFEFWFAEDCRKGGQV